MVNWGVLGTAGIAKGQTIPGMKQAENCCLYAIAGRDLAKAERFREEFGFAKAYGSYEELLDDPEIQAVYIPLPNMIHYEWTVKALEKKKHVLCEKPLAPDAAKAREMFRVAKENGVWLMEAFAYLHSPWVKAIQAEVDAGVIGKIRYMESEFLTSDYDPDNIRMRKETLGGCMYDLGCYTASMIGTMMGKQPDSIRALSSFNSYGVDDFVSALFMYEDGSKALMNCGMVLQTAAGKRADRLVIEGTDGAIYSDGEFNGCGIMTYKVIKDGIVTEKEVPVPNNYRLEVEQFGRCIENGESPYVSETFSVETIITIGNVLKEIGIPEE